MNSNARVYDRVTSFLGGMDAYKYPADLPLNQNVLLQNCIINVSGNASPNYAGNAVTRPGANQIDSTPSTFTNINPTGPIQGMGFLDNFTYGQFLLISEGGKLYTWNGSVWSDALAFTLTSADATVTMCQGIDSLLISDGAKAMQLYNGNAFTPCSTGPGDTSATNAPTGATAIAFIAGMFVVAGPSLVMGNGSTTTTYPPDTLFFSNYESAGEGDWNEDQSFRVGNSDGDPIIGLVPIQTTASTYPIYNLAVLKSNSIWIVALNPGAYASATNTTPAEIYGAMFAAITASAQGDQVGTGIGCVGRKAFCTYQNDLLFMSTYGVQSLQRMQAAAGQYQLTAPLSQPIQPYINRINWEMAYNIQAIKYQQYAIFFVPLDNSTVNNYALVWDGLLGQWMIWTGWTPECAVVTRFGSSSLGTAQTALVLGDSVGNVNQWQDGPTFYGLDSTYFDNGVAIPTNITTRSMVFGKLEFYKKIRDVIVRFNAGNATVSLAAFYDLGQQDSWNADATPSGVVLGTPSAILPFTLSSTSPVICYRSELGNIYCNEFYLTMSTTGGWINVRNVLAVAYLKEARDPTA